MKASSGPGRNPVPFGSSSFPGVCGGCTFGLYFYLHLYVNINPNTVELLANYVNGM